MVRVRVRVRVVVRVRVRVRWSGLVAGAVDLEWPGDRGVDPVPGAVRGLAAVRQGLPAHQGRDGVKGRHAIVCLYPVPGEYHDQAAILTNTARSLGTGGHGQAEQAAQAFMLYRLGALCW